MVPTLFCFIVMFASIKKIDFRAEEFARFASTVIFEMPRDSCTGRNRWCNVFSITWVIGLYQKPIRVETCNGPLCAWKQASEYSIC